MLALPLLAEVGTWVVLGVVGGLSVLILLYAVLVYNGLVSARMTVRQAWSNIDVQLKRRHDLIPNLVETVKGYAAHERGTLEEVISARSRATHAGTVPEKAEAENQLSGAIGRLLAVAEAYPDLKAAANFRALQEELTSTENKIAFARQYYNTEATSYNTRVALFPAVLFAGAMVFTPEPLFELDSPKERQAPQVRF